MKKLLFISLIVIVAVVVFARPSYAPLVNVVDDTDTGTDVSSDDDSDVSVDSDTVDLRDKDTDAPTWSPSFENK